MGKSHVRIRGVIQDAAPSGGVFSPAGQGRGWFSPSCKIHVYMRVVIMILVARGEGLAYAALIYFPDNLRPSELDNVLVPQGTPRLCLSSVHR